MEPILHPGYVESAIRPIGDQLSQKSQQDVNLAPDFVRAINSASADLCSKLADRRSVIHKNFVFFTPNILAAFGMLDAGAPADAKIALDAFLRTNEVKGDYHASFGKWIDNLSSRSVSQAAELEKSAITANKFFYKQSQAVITREDVTIPVETELRLGQYRPVQISFRNNGEAQSLTNAWVEKETEGKIKNLVEGNLPDRTVLMLVTAALFQGSWKLPFDEQDNSVETFHNSDGTKVKFTMMNLGIDGLRLYSDWKNHVTICELPFHGDTSLLVVNCGSRWDLNGAQAAANLKSFMTRENLLEMIENFDEQAQPQDALQIGIPKFNVKDKTDLFKELSSERIVQAIVGADWNGSLVEAGAGMLISTKQLVSEVQFQVDEAGAQVAAASYSPSGCESCDPEFKIEVPFGVILFDNKTKTILGLGQFLKFEGEPAENNY